MPTAKDIALSTASAQNQMAFQERMSNSAHQREVLDLKAAGLNPVLSAKLGGASTPSGAEGDYSGAEVVKLMNSTMNQAIKAAGNSTKDIVDSVFKTFSQFSLNKDESAQRMIDDWLNGNPHADDYDWTNNGVVKLLDNIGLGFNSRGQIVPMKGNSKNAVVGLGQLIGGSSYAVAKFGDYLRGKGWRSDSQQHAYARVANGKNQSAVGKKVNAKKLSLMEKLMGRQSGGTTVNKGSFSGKAGKF